jgi:hypothetical protein
MRAEIMQTDYPDFKWPKYKELIYDLLKSECGSERGEKIKLMCSARWLVFPVCLQNSISPIIP